jgi:hypothetical protein
MLHMRWALTPDEAANFFPRAFGAEPDPRRPPGSFDPRWRSADAVGLALGICEDRGFDRLSLLADALMNAGFDDEQVLAHCRADGKHVRGCWVVDLVLTRESRPSHAGARDTGRDIG